MVMSTEYHPRVALQEGAEQHVAVEPRLQFAFFVLLVAHCRLSVCVSV